MSHVYTYIPPPPEPKQPQPQQEEAEESYDPGEHTVDEVKEYVTEHPDEREAVLEAETAGKNRVTLVGWFEEEPPAEEDA